MRPNTCLHLFFIINTISIAPYHLFDQLKLISHVVSIVYFFSSQTRVTWCNSLTKCQWWGTTVWKRRDHRYGSPTVWRRIKAHFISVCRSLFHLF